MDWLTQFFGGLNPMGSAMAQGLSDGPMTSPASAPMMGGGGWDEGGFSSLGQALEPTPIPRSRPQVESVGEPMNLNPTDVGSATSVGGGGGPQQQPGQDFASKLVAGLRGVQAPAKPDVVKPSTPAAPRPTNAIRGGELFAILQALSQPQQQPRIGPTLGQSVGIGRY